jgi:hypothetical protein
MSSASACAPTRRRVSATKCARSPERTSSKERASTISTCVRGLLRATTRRPAFAGRAHAARAAWATGSGGRGLGGARLRRRHRRFSFFGTASVAVESADVALAQTLQFSYIEEDSERNVWSGHGAERRARSSAMRSVGSAQLHVIAVRVSTALQLCAVPMPPQSMVSFDVVGSHVPTHPVREDVPSMNVAF